MKRRLIDRNFANSQGVSKKCLAVLDMAEQDVITPLAPGEKPPPAFAGRLESLDARIAQLVEQRIENPRVGGSNPPPGTILSY